MINMGERIPPFLLTLRKGFPTQNLGIFDIPCNKIAFWRPSQRGFDDSKKRKNDIIALKRGQKGGISIYVIH